jgi:DNA invertase Pin-like site-specific DNA recombinase
MEATRKAVAYTRVSTARQGISGIGLDDQLAQVTAAVNRRGWTLTSHLSDEGLSGKRADNRPALTAALDQLAGGSADVLVVAKLDRLARSTVDLGRLMLRADAEGWDLVILDLDVDTSTPSGRLMLRVVGAVAEFESDLIADRARATHRQRRARGLRPGMAPLLPDTVRRRIATERAEGRTLRAIADDLNSDGTPTARGGRWHPSTVAHVLRSVAVDNALAAERVA